VDSYEIIDRLEKMGYFIQIETDHNTDTKRVRFWCNHWVNKTRDVTHTYSKEWTDMKIKKDVLPELMQAAGVRVTQTLEHY